MDTAKRPQNGHTTRDNITVCTDQMTLNGLSLRCLCRNTSIDEIAVPVQRVFFLTLLYTMRSMSERAHLRSVRVRHTGVRW